MGLPHPALSLETARNCPGVCEGTWSLPTVGRGSPQICWGRSSRLHCGRRGPGRKHTPLAPVLGSPEAPGTQGRAPCPARGPRRKLAAPALGLKTCGAASSLLFCLGR